MRLNDAQRKIDEALSNGAQLLDVRTQIEFQNGHSRKSKNIPLNELKDALNNLR